MVTSPNTVIAYATGDLRYPALQREAVLTAAQSEARLILYDIDGGAADRAPAGAQPRDQPAPGDHALLPEQLEAGGHPGLAEQVRRIREDGVDAYGWVPRNSDNLDDFIDYAEQEQAEIVMVPAELAEPGLIDRLRRRMLGRILDTAHFPVVVVGADGDSQMYEAQLEATPHTDDESAG